MNGEFNSKMTKTVPVRTTSAKADVYLPQTSTGLASRRKRGEPSYSELAARLFNGPESRSAIAFAAINRGEGVTRTVSGLAGDLTRGGRHVAVLDGKLRPLHNLSDLTPEFGVDPTPALVATHFSSDQFAAVRMLANIREQYDAALIDCGSLESSMDLLYVAPAADGVVLVIEAGRQSKQQVDRATDLISNAGGRFLGFVLNKRRYPVPGWLYRIL
jgi:Mrp family chromosome partitioning ATPase